MYTIDGALCRQSCLVTRPSAYLTPQSVNVDGRARTAPSVVNVWLRDGTYVVISITSGSIHVRKPDASAIDLEPGDPLAGTIVDPLHPPIRFAKEVRREMP